LESYRTGFSKLMIRRLRSSFSNLPHSRIRQIALAKSNYKVYVYIVKSNYRSGGMLFTTCEAQLYVFGTGKTLPGRADMNQTMTGPCWLKPYAVLRGSAVKSTDMYSQNYKVYVYIAKHNYRLGGMLFTTCEAQLHVSATIVGHLQVLHRKFINHLYMHLQGCVGCRGEV